MNRKDRVVAQVPWKQTQHVNGTMRENTDDWGTHKNKKYDKWLYTRRQNLDADKSLPKCQCVQTLQRSPFPQRVFGRWSIMSWPWAGTGYQHDKVGTRQVGARTMVTQHRCWELGRNGWPVRPLVGRQKQWVSQCNGMGAYPWTSVSDGSVGHCRTPPLPAGLPAAQQPFALFFPCTHFMLSCTVAIIGTPGRW